MFFLLLALAANLSLVKVEGPAFLVDLRYNSVDNFLKKNVYADFRLSSCYVHPDLARRLDRLAALLEEKGLKLVFWDCFRPLEVQKAMWEIVPDNRYVANPKNGSNHNRGIAVDVTLARPDGTPLDMPTGFDDFSAKASPRYVCAPVERTKCENRDLLIAVMGRVGLKPLATEWWHYQLPAKGYPIISGPPRTGKAGCFGSNRGANPDSPPDTPHRGNIPAKCGDVTDEESTRDDKPPQP